MAEILNEDYKVSMCGPLYSRYSVSNHKFLTEVSELDDALAFIRDHMDKEQYFPNVWYINDHGNVDLMNVKTGEFIDNDDGELDHGFEEGDEVYWVDPDDDLCSKAGTILAVQGDVIILKDETQCYAEELTKQQPDS